MMNRIPHARSARAPFLLIALSIMMMSGCGALSQPYPDKAHFTIDPGNPAPVAGVKPPLNGVLGLERVRISEPYRTNQFVYRTGPSATVDDYYNVFITPPEEILTATSTDWFVKSNIASATIDLPSPMDNKFTADIEVSELYVDLTDGDKPRAIIAAQLFLMEDNGAVRTIIVQTRSRHEVPCKTKDGQGIAEAWNEAWRLTLVDFEKSIRNRP